MHMCTHMDTYTCICMHTLTHTPLPWGGGVMLQAFTAKAEPMRGWDARPQIRRWGTYLEIYHPVRHESHHHRQELHQHLEVGHVFLWRRTPWVRPLVRQQKGTFRVSVRPQERNKKTATPQLSLAVEPPSFLPRSSSFQDPH